MQNTKICSIFASLFSITTTNYYSLTIKHLNYMPKKKKTNEHRLENIHKNFSYIKLKYDLSQDEMAAKLSAHLEAGSKPVSGKTIGQIECAWQYPSSKLVIALSNFSGYTLDELWKLSLSDHNFAKNQPEPHAVTGWREIFRETLVISVGPDGRENIIMVPDKASAGYVNGFADTEYVETLPNFRLPFMPHDVTLRAFEIKGDSMPPLPTGSIVIAEYVERWQEIKNGHTYVVISQREGIVYKRVYNHINERGVLVMRSDNPIYDDYELSIEDDVKEVWRARGFIIKTSDNLVSFQFKVD